jgi:N-acetylglucosaminyldiphosphoundecaprenol N-acetyl-beta-D-mannosaminyltransferase
MKGGIGTLSPRIRLFGIELDAVRLPEAVARVGEWATEPFTTCRFVVTPNVDHIVQLQTKDDMRLAYREAALVIADGQPIVWASRWLGRPLPERVAGSDLVPQLFASATAERPLRVMLLGAAPGVGLRAAERIRAAWPSVEIVAVDSPPLGFEHDPVENERIVRLVESSAPQLLIVGLGAPKQELWTLQHRDRLRANVVLCVGATIDFLAGDLNRAPNWMRQCGLEWFYRLACEPRRLAKRYLRDAWHFPQLIWQERRRTSLRNTPLTPSPGYAGRRVD